jgi:hypothetical protein
MKRKPVSMKKLILLTSILVIAYTAYTQNKTEIPYYLRDRGEGMPTSMFGTYIRKSEFIIYPFYEYYSDRNAEYKPAELGYSLEQDFRGRYKAHEGLIFLGYGITDRLAIEMEAAMIDAVLYKSPNDPSGMPPRFSESGLGDVEGQARYRWTKETMHHPEFYSYFEMVLPLQKNKKLIGTQDWEFKLGSGVIKGFTWGTITLRAALEYNTGEGDFVPGEYALEYLKKLSEFFRFGIVFEGSQDEASVITDLQFHISKKVFIRLNNGFGISSKATDFTPEIGILFHFQKDAVISK